MSDGKADESNFDGILAGIRQLNQAAPDEMLPLHAPVFQGKEREYVLDTIESTFVSSVGAYVNRFEDMLREVTGARHVSACVNGTAALHLSLLLAGVKPGDLVLAQGLSFVATANAIAHAGAEPVFLDVDEDTLGLSPGALRDFLSREAEKGLDGPRHKASGRRLAACVPMHTFGFPCRMAEIMEIARDWSLPVVEDAAEALGSSKSDRHCGTWGLLAILSFNGNKICTTGGGGAILTNDPELGRLAKHLSTTAKRPHAWEFFHDSVAWNYRLPNLNAALGCAQLEQLNFFVEYKRKLADAYQALFRDTPWTFLREPAGTRSNYWLTAVLFRDREERDAFLDISNKQGLQTRPVWEPLHTLPAYATCIRGPLDTTLDLASRLVNLPSGVRGRVNGSGL